MSCGQDLMIEKKKEEVIKKNAVGQSNSPISRLPFVSTIITFYNAQTCIYFPWGYLLKSSQSQKRLLRKLSALL